MQPETDDASPVGRLLVESGAAVAGSMSRSAAQILFEPSTSRVRLDTSLAAFLARAAASAAIDPGAVDPGAEAFGREQVRAGAALAFAVELVVTRTAEGRRLRDDGFLSAGREDRVPADELAEAVVLAARRTVEEWRVRHLGYLLAEAVLSPDLDVAVVARGLRTAESLTGRQLALLAAVGRRERVPLPMAPLPADPRGWTAWGALEDVTDLRRGDLLEPPQALPRPGGAALPRLRLADLRLTRRGVLVHRLFVLDLVREERIAAALADFGLPRS